MYNSQRLRIGVIYGSRTCEHDVSIISALQAANALNRNEYEVTLIYIDRTGAWYVGEALANMSFYSAFDPYRVTRVDPTGENGKLVLKRSRRRFFAANVLATLDVCLTVMHGLNGEDGTLQGMLELFDVPYTSAGVSGSAVGMDKILMKQVFTAAGLPVVDGVWFTRDEWGQNPQAQIKQCEEKLGYPMFVKPANLGSSIGIGRADDQDQLTEAIETACAYDRRILVEKAITDLKEVNCAVLGYGSDIETGELEMPLPSDEFLDFSDKYLRGGKNAKGSKGSKGMQSLARQIPAPIPEETAAAIRDMARIVFRTLDLKGVVRIDFILDTTGKVYVNEANTIPGSLSFYLYEPKGVTYAQLLDRMVEYAFRAHADRNKSVFSYDSNILNSVISGGSKGKLQK